MRTPAEELVDLRKRNKRLRWLLVGATLCRLVVMTLNWGLS